jgi:hypothetical protein
VIGYYAHHHGSGHITRLQAIAAYLPEPVCGLSSLPAPEGWQQAWLRLARDDTPSPQAAAAAGDPTAGGMLHWAPAHHAGLARRMAQVAEWAARERPRLLVVDVSVELALLGRLCGVPTVVVAMPGRRFDRPHRLAYDSAQALLAPWPEGAHTEGWPPAWREKACFTGGFSRFDGRPRQSLFARDGRHRVLVLWGSGGRRTGADELAAARAATPGWDWVERDPALHPSSDLWGDLLAADVVVTHAGQNAVAEVAAAGRPAVVVAQPRPFGEQEATAAAVQRLEAAIGLPRWPQPDEWPGLLDRAAARGGSGWGRWSSGDGARAAAARLAALAAGPVAEGVA